MKNRAISAAAHRVWARRSRAERFAFISERTAAQRKAQAKRPKPVSVKTREYHVIAKAKNRAKNEGVPFDLTVADVSFPTRCPVFDILLCYSNKVHARDNSPSFDKVIPERGYVRGNVRIISHRANRLKSDCTITELRQILNYMEDTL